MSIIWTERGPFRRVGYPTERDLEGVIQRVSGELFGPHRIYLDVKHRIGKFAGLRNVPDGYLIDLRGQKPLLYVVEVELAAHEPLRHIAVQILEFSLSFESDQRAVKSILMQSLQSRPDARQQCESYVARMSFRNLDHLLDALVYDSPFMALVVIDELPDGLETVLARKFKFGVEVLELARYQNASGDGVYRFEPFLEDLETEAAVGGEGDQQAAASGAVEATDIDTVVVPAREEGFKETFLGENRWYAVRIHGMIRPQIKYIAAYQVQPVQAITHIAPVQSIEPWKDSGKSVVNFAEPAQEIPHIPMLPGGRIRSFQSLRYTTRARLLAAKTLDEVF